MYQCIKCKHLRRNHTIIKGICNSCRKKAQAKKSFHWRRMYLVNNGGRPSDFTRLKKEEERAGFIWRARLKLVKILRYVERTPAILPDLKALTTKAERRAAQQRYIGRKQTNMGWPGQEELQHYLDTNALVLRLIRDRIIERAEHGLPALGPTWRLWVTDLDRSIVREAYARVPDSRREGLITPELNDEK